ncbi:MAG: leucine-rich repeat protein [Clostridiales bacterium]|nr:leucine-rich repeat protein [Clostridiales bacterium]
MCLNLSLKGICVIKIPKLAILTVVLIFVLSTYTKAATIDSGLCGDSVTYVLDDNGTLTISGSGDMYNYTSSSSAPWYSSYYGNITTVIIESGITKIGNYAFYGCIGIEKISIPDTVTAIGSSAFCGCTNLTDITLPESVTDINSFYIFKGCTSLVTISIPYGETILGQSAFDGCTSLESVILPDSVITINQYAFRNCTSLKTINIPNSVQYFSSYIFYGCASLEEITIPDGVSDIGAHFFEGCANLISVTLPDSVSIIDDYAFYNCTSLKNITLPGSLTSIEYYAFGYCSSITEITVPGSTSYVGGCVFSGCTGLADLTISDGVEIIETSAFSHCSALTEVIIPDSVTNVGQSAFSFCKDLVSINVPNSVKSLGSSAFYYCTSLKTIYLSSSITSIGKLTFRSCTSLVSITIPDSVESIDEAAFYDCSSLTSITIPPSVTSIFSLSSAADNLKTVYCSEGSTADNSSLYPRKTEIIYYQKFGYCGDNAAYLIYNDGNNVIISGIGDMDYSYNAPWNSYKEVIVSVVIESGITSIGNYAFYNCTNLSSITIPNSVEKIQYAAFYYCTSLTEITLPDKISTISNYAFCGCKSLTDIIIPDSVTQIGNSAFHNCASITSINIPEGVTAIEYYSFSGCTNLTDITIPENVYLIDEYAFMSCKSLRSIDLPDSITTIENEAFCNCSSLTSITIPERISSIDVNTFSNCSSLTNIIMPYGLAKIGSRSFYNCPLLKTIYYKGTESEWNEIAITSTGNENLLNADIIYLYQTDSESGVNIYSSNVLGGIKITLSSDNAQTIYYTTDGTIPTTRSKVYEKPFTLTESGSYTIETMAYDGTACSDIALSSIELSKMSKPSIICNNSIVTITAEDGAAIYYNYSLTPPTTSSNIYNETFTVSTSVYISAVAIKAGYAKSNTAILYCAGNEEKEDYQPLTDSYSFSNVKESFGYSIIYKIPKSSYISVFGETLGSALYNVYAYTDSGSLKFWKGSCFGMALTSMLFYANGLNPSEYCSSDYDRLYDVSAPASADASLTKLIERCQVSQFLPIIQTEMSYEEEDGGNWVQSGFGDLSSILSAAQNCSSEPVIFYISSLKDDDVYGHAVLPYRVENSDDDSNVFYVYIYDCDIPNNEDGEENYIIIDLSENTFLYNGIDTYDYAISFVKISSLIDNDTVSLLEDDDIENNASVMTDNYLFITNSNDTSIYNDSSIEVGNISGAVKYGTMGIEDSTGIMWLLPDDDYTVVNNDSSISKFKVNIVDEVDSFTLTTDDLSAEISFGRYSDRLYISSSSDSKANIVIDTYNSTKKENSISLCSDYVYVKPYNDDIVELYTNTGTITANNIVFSLDTYSGNFVDAGYMLLVNKNAALRVEKDCEISVLSKPQISSNTFSVTLKLNLINNGEVSESGTLYIALYDEDTNKILAEQS